MAKHPAAFINALEEGTKAEAIEWLQRTWDDLKDAEAKLGKVIAALKEDAYPCHQESCHQAVCRLARELLDE